MWGPKRRLTALGCAALIGSGCITTPWGEAERDAARETPADAPDQAETVSDYVVGPDGLVLRRSVPTPISEEALPPLPPAQG